MICFLADWVSIEQSQSLGNVPSLGVFSIMFSKKSRGYQEKDRDVE